ncbi:hypothetical protein J4417_05645 [Candidatus Woesearchaeota archaeon]|nr:hypothetical protein [Candidatus Woesearchaeota archaeon]
MSLCIDTHYELKEYLEDKDILIRKKVCQIYMVGEGERIPDGRPGVLSYIVSQRTPTILKNAYVKLGNVPLGWFYSTPKQGIFVEEVELPNPFEWKKNWPSLEKLVDCDISAKIKEKFGINIAQYLGVG